MESTGSRSDSIGTGKFFPTFFKGYVKFTKKAIDKKA